MISGLILAVSSEAKAQIGSIGISSPMRNQSIIQQSTYNVVVDFYWSIWNPGDIIIVTLYKNNSGSPPAMGGQSPPQAVPKPPATGPTPPMFVPMTAPIDAVGGNYTLWVEYYDKLGNLIDWDIQQIRVIP